MHSGSDQPTHVTRAAPLLVVEDLVVDLGRTRVVDHVCFELATGEVLGLAGESGSGKTTLALALAGLLAPGATCTGRVLLEGQDLLALDTTALTRVRGARLGFVFQEPLSALNPVHSVRRQIDEVLRLHQRSTRAERRGTVERMLAEVGLDARIADAYPHQLSGGQRQRVLIAMALAARPALLIADEPTTALDTTLQVQLLDLLRSLQRALELTVLLVSHDLALLAEICDRVALMFAGQIVEIAPARALFATPAHPYAAWLVDPSLPSPATSASSSTLSGPGADASARGCRYRTRCPRAQPRCAETLSLSSLGPARQVRCCDPLTR